MIWLLSLLVACDRTSAVDPAQTKTTLFEVPEGSSAKGLGGALAKEGLVRSASQWEWFLKLDAEGGGGCIKAGFHKVSPSMDAPTLLKALCGAPVPKDEPFTVVEGWRIREIDAALTEKGWIQAGAYAEAAKNISAYKADFPLPSDTLEGYLYPETFRVEPDHFDPAGLIQRQLNTFNDRFYKANKDKLGKRSLHEIVVMGSMLEREEPSPANRPLVSGILWKRIDANWALGVDATSRYTLEDWNDRDAFMKKLRDPNDPWNTRLKTGLPPTPIGNPSAGALEAAISPKESEFWYYLHDSTQTIHPSRNKEEHEAYRKKYNVY